MVAAHGAACSGDELESWLTYAVRAASREVPGGRVWSHCPAAAGSIFAHEFMTLLRASSRRWPSPKLAAQVAAASGSIRDHCDRTDNAAFSCVGLEDIPAT